MKFNSSNPLIKQIDALESKVNHSMVLYDIEEYGQLVQNRFIENGLTKEENSFYLTYRDPKLVENDLEEYGIDVDLFKKRNLLHIFQIKNFTESTKEVKQNLEKLYNQLTVDLKPPFRFVGRIIPNISTVEGIKTELMYEHIFHSNFDKYQCSFLCTYPIEAIEKTNRPEWLTHLLKNHHNLIYATDPKNAVTFDTELINS